MDLLKRGSIVPSLTIKMPRKHKKIAKELEESYGIKARYYPLDILEPEQYKELFTKIDADFDRVDFFISNAIISGRSVVGGFAPFMRLKPKGLNNIYTATVLAFVVGAQEAAKRMKESGGGSIISLSSTGNLVYTPNYAGHGSSKNAVETMVKYAASDLGEWGIRVNCVSGGPIDTDALKAFPDYEEIKAIVEKQSAMGRMGNLKILWVRASSSAMRVPALGSQDRPSSLMGERASSETGSKPPHPLSNHLLFFAPCRDSLWRDSLPSPYSSDMDQLHRLRAFSYRQHHRFF